MIRLLQNLIQKSSMLQHLIHLLLEETRSSQSPTLARDILPARTKEVDQFPAAASLSRLDTNLASRAWMINPVMALVPVRDGEIAALVVQKQMSTLERLIRPRRNTKTQDEVESKAKKKIRSLLDVTIDAEAQVQDQDQIEIHSKENLKGAFEIKRRAKYPRLFKQCDSSDSRNASESSKTHDCGLGV
jgi:hypothetical protein